MAPVRSRPFLVDVHLSQEVQSAAGTITVSKDVYAEASTADHSRYIALSTRHSQHWDLYLVRQSTEQRSSSVWLPGSIYKKYGGQLVYARVARPIPLKSVLLSFPNTTYHLVKEDSHDLEVLLSSGSIMRTGDSVEINGYRGSVTFCEPVRQGILVSTTEFVLAKEQPKADTYSILGEISDDEDQEEVSSSTMFSSLLRAPVDSVLSLTSTQFGQPGVQRNSGWTGEVHCRSAPLTMQIPRESIEPVAKAHEDTDYRAFASLERLLDLGCFSGDYITVHALHGAQESARQLRLYSLPQDYPGGRKDTLYLAPVLYHNIAGQSEDLRNAQELSVVRMESLTARPVAKSVTLARVPSPASTDRALSSAFFAALKSHFESSRRIVRAGDLILLGIDETMARVTATEDNENEIMAEFVQSSSARMDTFGWFKVVEVEIEQDEAWRGDAQVDAGSTRMVQSGIEKVRIPPVSQWATFYGLPSPMIHADETGTTYARLYSLINATFSKTARRARACASIMLHGARGSGKKSLASSVCAALGMHFLEINCYDIVGETDVKTEAYLRLKFEKASHCSPCLLLLRNVDALAKKKDDMESGQESAMRFILADCLNTVASEAGNQFPVAVVATTADKDKVPDGVLGCFRHEIEIGAPDEAERLAILQTLVQGLPLAPDVSIQALAVRSAALVAADLVNVVKRAQNFAQDRMDDIAARHPECDGTDLLVAGVWITADDFDQATSEARRNYSDSIGAPKIPNVTWDDVGGLASVKDDIMDTIQLPLERPELFSSGMKKRSGILFYGPPGTGKTLLAKAVATSFSLNFFSVKGPELLNMYIGESEANVRRVFQRARDAKPCVVFFDELDSVAPKRGNQGDSGGVMDRIVSQLLSELDGMAEGKDGSGGVFVIGATNRPDLLDPALLRPGRFDKMLYLGVSDTDDAQYNILSALTRKFRLAPSLDLRSIARVCPFTYTGADFYALCSDAMLKAMTRQAGNVDAKVKALDPPRTTQYFFDHLATKEDVEVIVSEADFREALRELVPSVSQSELDHYKKVQAQFSPIKKEEERIVDKGKGKVMNGIANGVHGHFQDDGGEEDGEMYA